MTDELTAKLAERTAKILTGSAFEELLHPCFPATQQSEATMKPKLAVRLLSIIQGSSPKFGCLMAMLPSLDSALPNWAADNIPVDTLAEDGIETEIHCTMLYGFHLDFASLKLKQFFLGHGPIKLRLGKLSRFECPEYDVIKLSVESPELVELHKQLNEHFADEITPSEYSYNPHVTVAYVKKGTNQNLNGQQFEGHECTVNQLLYSLPEKKGRMVISLFGLPRTLTASEPAGHAFHGNQWTMIDQSRALKHMEISRDETLPRAQRIAHVLSANAFSGVNPLKDWERRDAHRKAADAHNEAGNKAEAEMHEAIVVHNYKDTGIFATRQRAPSLAIRAAAVLSRPSRQPPDAHSKARDAAQAIYEAAALAAAAKQKKKEEKRKREEEIAAILLLLLLAGEDAYKKAYNILGTDGLKAYDETQIGEQAKTFAAIRQPVLKDYSGKLADALEKARIQAQDEKLDEVETERLLRETAQKVSHIMADAEAQVTYGSVQIDRLARAGFSTKIWETMHDDRVRPSHVDCNEQGELPLDKPFINGLKFPGDPAGPPSEICGCRCWLIGGRR